MHTVYQFPFPYDGLAVARLIWYRDTDVVEIVAYGSRVVGRMSFVEFRKQWEKLAEYRASRSPELWAETEARKVPDIKKLAGGEHDVQR